MTTMLIEKKKTRRRGQSRRKGVERREKQKMEEEESHSLQEVRQGGGLRSSEVMAGKGIPIFLTYEGLTQSPICLWLLV